MNSDDEHPPGVAADRATVPSPLGALVHELDTRTATAWQTGDLPELPALEEFRALWTKVRAASQLRRSFEHVPSNAGPLNADALIHRSIALMRELSPAYLQQFLSYTDDLAALEVMAQSQVAAVGDAPRAATIGKRARPKPRNRRE